MNLHDILKLKSDAEQPIKDGINEHNEKAAEFMRANPTKRLGPIKIWYEDHDPISNLITVHVSQEVYDQ